MSVPKYEWVDNPEGFVKGVTAAIMPSGIALCTIHARRRGLVLRTTEYVLLIRFTHRLSGRPIGGYYDTFEDAKKDAEDAFELIFGDVPVHL